MPRKASTPPPTANPATARTAIGPRDSSPPTQVPQVQPPSQWFNGGSWGPLPVMSADLTFKQVGSAGLRAFGGYIREEFLPQLVGRESARVYREMVDNDATVGAIMFAITQTMRQVDWHVDGPDDTPKSREMQEFVQGCMDDMSESWAEFITEVLTMLPYGYAPHEINYKRRDGRNPGGKLPKSKFDDGKIGIRNLPLRGQDTILKWFFDDFGDIAGVTQQPWIGNLIDIPVEKMLLFRPRIYKGNPEGYALDPGTKIPTPDGWRILDDLKVGDKIFDDTGKIRYVTARADWEDRPCYEITFGDGTKIIADENHQWVTTTLSERSRGLPGQVRQTKDFLASLKTNVGSSNHGIAWAGALDYPEQLLPISPYYLGLWLGDGTSATTAISCHVNDMEETASYIEADGYVTKLDTNGDKNGNGRLIRVYGDKLRDAQGPQALLSSLGLKNNKHIPAQYLHGSIKQRKALLSGLMDSDGHADHTGRCEFSNVNYLLASGVAELVRSLGIGAKLSRKRNSNGNNIFLVKFTPTWAPFKLARKIARCRTERQRMNHFVANVEAVMRRRTVCIEVDSPSHLFLAGESMIPTHNSVLRQAYRPYYFIKRLQEQEAVMFERFSGFPVVTVPSALLEAAAQGDGNAVQALAEYKRIVTNARIDEQMGGIFPSDTYKDANGSPTAVPMYEFKLIAPQQSKAAISANQSIERYKLEIMTGVLADFLQLGHSSRGTQSIAMTKVDLFFQAIEGWMGSISDVLNNYLLPRLWDLNNFDYDYMPRFRPDMPQRVDLDALSNFVMRLGQVGFITPDPDTEEYLRNVANLPDISQIQATDIVLGENRDAVTTQNPQKNPALDQTSAANAGPGPGVANHNIGGRPPSMPPAAAPNLKDIVAGSLARRMQAQGKLGPSKK